MKPIMHLYSDKVTITDKKELMPLMKSDNIHVAGSVNPRVIYTNVSKENLDEFISKNMETHLNLMILKLAVDTVQEVKTVPDLRIINDTVSIEETSKADVLMINRGRSVVIVRVNGKIYTNNVLVAKKCIMDDIVNGDFDACMLKTLIDLEGLIECELKVE